MTIARRLLSATGGGGSIVPPPSEYAMLYNGRTAASTLIDVGLATSDDSGLTWTRYSGNPVLQRGAGGTFDDDRVHGVSVLWDGSQWVCYYGGYDGTNYRIGRATSDNLVSWSKYGSNPVLNLGAGGAFDDYGVLGPVVRYDPDLSPPWQMWYTGIPDASGAPKVGYADSSDGLSWTRRGVVIDLGSSGQFDDEGAGSGAVILVGSTYHFFYHGTAGTNNTKTGRVTCTDPADSGTYTKQGVCPGLDVNITSLDDGLEYRSNAIRTVLARGNMYVGYGSAIQPIDPPDLHEVSFRTTSEDLVTWTTPTGELLPLDEGTFDTISAENPSVVVA